MTDQVRERVNLVEHPATTIAEEEGLASDVAAALPMWALSLDEVFDEMHGLSRFAVGCCAESVTRQACSPARDHRGR